MVTRREADALAWLLEQTTELEDLARRVQEDDDAPDELIRQLRTTYQNWYAKSLAILPTEMKGPFDTEFAGTFLSFRIKAFLDNPRQPTALDLESAPEQLRQTLSPWTYPWQRTFRSPLNAQRQILLNLQAELEVGGSTIAVLEYYSEVFSRFAYSIAEIGRPIRADRPGIQIDDEYALQRLMHTLLVALSDEVEAEEYSPTRLGSSPRIDFIIHDHEIAVEAKYMRDSLTRRKLGDDLAADVLRYSGHPNAKGLLVVVHDPNRRYSNPVGLQADLQRLDESFPVRVVFVS